MTQLFNLGAVAAQTAGGVAFAAHVGGFIFGVIMVRLFEARAPLQY